MVMALGESANIRVIEGIHAAMLEEFQIHEDLELDLSQITDADVSFLQLIEAGRKFASANGKGFRLVAPAGPPLVSLLERAGFLAEDNPDSRAFWLEGGVQ
jgi:anti-anti-sigma regulatory factor